MPDERSGPTVQRSALLGRSSRSFARRRTRTASSRPRARRSSSSSGLGRGLDGILGGSPANDSTLLHLLGGRGGAPIREARKLLIEIAVASIVSKFEAEAVVVAGARVDGEAEVITTHAPPSWSDASSTAFEVHGRLWSQLASGTGSQVTELGGHHVLICGYQRAGASLSVAVVRRLSFSPDDQRLLARLVRSLLAAASDPQELGNVPVAVEVRPVIGAVEVRVSLDFGDGRRGAMGHDASTVVATAKATVALFNAQYEVVYAGEVVMSDHSVYMVVVLDADQAPLVGLAVRAGIDTAGPAHAALSALSGADDLKSLLVYE